MKTLIDNLQKYYGIYLLGIAVLFLILWFPNRAVNRYAIGVNENDDIYILDTRTGHAWLRRRYAVIDLGTVDEPKYEYVKRRGDIIVSGQAIQNISVPKPTPVSLGTCGVVTGILFNGETPMAIIDNKVVGVGQSIYSVKVVKINEDSVEFEKSGVRWSQKVNEQVSANWP